MQRRRVAARKYGSLRAARRIPLAIGSFTKRKLVRLRDNYTIIVNSEVNNQQGFSLQGHNVTRHFCLNDLTDPQMLGYITQATPPGGVAPVDFYHSPTSYSQMKNAIVPLSTQFSNVYNKITVIGTKMTIHMTNNCTQQFHPIDSAQGSNPGARQACKVWYAYRLDPYVITENCPKAIDSSLTYAALKETGKWTMGVIQASSTDKFASKKIVIKYSGAKFWPYNFGKPDGSCDQPFNRAFTNDSGEGPADVTVAVPQNNRCVLRMVFGPMPVMDKGDLRTTAPPAAPDFITDHSKMAWIQDVRVNVKTEYMCSLGDLQAINGLDASGIDYPSAPTLAHTFKTDDGLIPQPP